MNAHPAIAKGHVAVITGGASGIGLAAADAIGKVGMTVVLADLPGRALNEAASALSANGITVFACPTDVSVRGEMEELKLLAAQHGPVTLLMNNAGCGGGGGFSAPEAVWRKALETNLWGAIHGIQLFVPAMVASGLPGAVISTGSKQGITLPPGDTAYNVSKAALKALTESLAHDLMKQTGSRITAHLFIPGFTYTGFTRARGVTEKPAGAWTPEQVVSFMMDRMTARDFYILCPDNEVGRATDLKRMRWGFGDILESRPALSRWHPDYAAAFKAYMEEND